MGKQQYRWLVLIVALVFSSAYFFLFSKSGLLERMRLDDEKINIIARTEVLKGENNRLRRLLERYRGGNYPDGDIASSGYTRHTDTIIQFRGLNDTASVDKKKDITVQGLPADLFYLRIAWAALSSVVLICMLLYGRRIKEQQAP